MPAPPSLPRYRRLWLLCLFSSLLVCLLTSRLPAQTSVLTQHNDNARTGANLKETLLKPATLGPTDFGKLFAQRVDGQVYAQPLYVPQLAITGRGIHNVVLVATEHNSVYAFDADSNEGANATPLWHVNLTPAGGTTVPYQDTGAFDINPEIGITGTPVIEATTQTLYVVAKFKRADGTYGQQLHALALQDGSEKFGGPVEIEGSVRGTGDGSTNGILPFNPLRQMNRPALLLSKGVIYIVFSAHGDVLPYHGWVFAYHATTLQRLGLFCTTPDGKTDPSGYPLGGGGSWMGGAGPAADADGALYFTTGNGTFSAPHKGTGKDFGDSILKLRPFPVMDVADYFTPFLEDNLNRADADLGSGGVIVLPDEVGSPEHPRLLIGAGKEGRIYLLDRDNMGKYHADYDAVVQSVENAVGGVWGKPAYWNGRVYFGANGDVIKAFRIQNGRLTITPDSQGSDFFGYPGATPSLSANGKSDGIAWVIRRGEPSAILQAYDATDLSKKIYDSNQTDERDTTGPYVKFSVPTIAEGHVFVGTSNTIEVFGRGKWVAKPIITPPGGSFYPSTLISLTCATPGAAIHYTTDGSEPTEASPRYINPFLMDNCVTVKARGFAVGYRPSAIANATFTADLGPSNGDGLLASYYDGVYFQRLVVQQIDPVVDITENTPPIPGLPYNRWSARWTGYLMPRCTGLYRFATFNNDGVRLWINDQLVIDDWNYHTPLWNYGSFPLVAGQRYSIRMEFFNDDGVPAMRLLWSPLGGPFEVIPQSQLFSGRPIQARPPVILPRGGTFETTATVTITTPSTGATLRYTLDGSEPSANSALYTKPITLNQSSVVRAKAFLPHAWPSDSRAALYTRNPNPARYRLNAGGNPADPFSADAFFLGGEGHSRVGAIDTRLVVAPAPQPVYEAQRFSNEFGDFSYLIPALEAGKDYLLRLHFADSEFANPWQRIFNLTINGKPYLFHYDIVGDAGGPFTAVIKEYIVTADPEGKIRLDFESFRYYAKVSGIEVIPALVSQEFVGNGDGLNAAYYDNTDFTGTLVTRTDAQIDFDWGGGGPDPAVGTEDFSCRWTGYIQPPTTGEYAFHTVSDDGVRLWIDDKLLVDDWTPHAAAWNVGHIPLIGGRKYRLRMEFFESGGAALVHLYWSGPRTPLQVVPRTQLYTQAKTTISGKVRFLERTVPQAENLEFVFRPKEGDPLQWVVAVAADGTFSVANIPQGHYAIALKRSNTLQQVMTADASSGPALGVTFDLIPGDANDDNSVDIFDLATLAEAFNTAPGDLAYSAACDFNNDTSVDLFDLAILAQYFNLEGDP